MVAFSPHFLGRFFSKEKEQNLTKLSEEIKRLVRIVYLNTSYFLKIMFSLKILF